MNTLQNEMAQIMFARFDLSNRRRIFAAGDIHGRFDLLENRLEELRFDPHCDNLILLGDLVDRGAFNEDALKWCQKPSVLRIRGNHDQLLHRAVVGSQHSRMMHVVNGGLWFDDITDPAERKRWADIIVDCPIAIEATTPHGRRIGFIHADVPTKSWDELEPALRSSRRTLSSSDPLDRESVGWQCMWKRDRITDLKHFIRDNGSAEGFNCSIPGIDHVFFGHSIVAQPLVHGNCSWIDTGAFKRDILTVVDVDQWLDEHANNSRDASPQPEIIT